MFNQKQIRVRIAPSPTGPLHIGTARSALFNYLFAKKNQGKFILRIEDTDLERSEPKWEKEIIKYLQWLGLKSNESPNKKGDYGPYRQSERIPLYRQYLEKLLKQGDAYYCYCTEKELAEERLLQQTKGEPPRYSGKCRDLTEGQIKSYQVQGIRPVIRFRMPNQKIQFSDLIRGDLEFDCSLMGDLVIAKGLNIPLYNFAVIIDDYLMRISHVIRGEDHLTNTPKQIAMQRALGLPQPQYAHLPLILNPDRSKMSKRAAANGQTIPVAISEFKTLGYLPEALINFMVFLGWNPKNNRELFTLSELAQEFNLKNVNRSGAVFNLDKLNNLNGYYIRQMKIENLTELIVNERFIKFNLDHYPKNYLQKAIQTVQERLKKLSEVQSLTHFYFQAPKYDKNLLIWKKNDFQTTKKFLTIGESLLEKIDPSEFEKEKLELKFKNYILKNKLDTGSLLWPLRVALTGEKASPNPFEVMTVLGKNEALKRVKTAIIEI